MAGGIVRAGQIKRRADGAGRQTRRKIALVALARLLLIICWAMLRDGTDWREPTARAA